VKRYETVTATVRPNGKKRMSNEAWEDLVFTLAAKTEVNSKGLVRIEAKLDMLLERLSAATKRARG
jgi:hypothetical protein